MESLFSKVASPTQTSFVSRDLFACMICRWWGCNFFACETWPVNNEWYWQTGGCAKSQTGGCQSFSKVIMLIEEKTRTHSGDVKHFRPLGRGVVNVHPYSFSTNEVLRNVCFITPGAPGIFKENFSRGHQFLSGVIWWWNLHLCLLLILKWFLKHGKTKTSNFGFYMFFLISQFVVSCQSETFTRKFPW